MTDAEVTELVGIMAAAFPHNAITEQTISVYAMMLGDLDAGETSLAVKRLLSECKFFPTIAEIRAAVMGNRLPLCSGEEAWGEVMRAIRAVGIYGAPCWSSPAVQQAVRAIGWDVLCLTDLDDLGTTRAQFMRTYTAYRDRMQRNENLASLGLPLPARLPSSTDASPWDDGASSLRPIGDVLPLRRPGGAS